MMDSGIFDTNGVKIEEGHVFAILHPYDEYTIYRFKVEFYRGAYGFQGNIKHHPFMPFASHNFLKWDGNKCINLEVRKPTGKGEE